MSLKDADPGNYTKDPFALALLGITVTCCTKTLSRTHEAAVKHGMSDRQALGLALSAGLSSFMQAAAKHGADADEVTQILLDAAQAAQVAIPTMVAGYAIEAAMAKASASGKGASNVH